MISTLESKMLLLWLILTIGLQSAESVGTDCNLECLSKTICAASDGSLGCDKNILIKVTFASIDNRTDFGTDIEMTVVGRNVMSTIPWTISAQLSKSNTQIVYSCKKDADGNSTSQVIQEGNTIESGSSSYSDGDLTCTWLLSINDPAWPMFNGSSADLVNDNQWRVELRYGSKSYPVASDTNEMPFYHRKYLKCCNQFYGNNDYQLFTKQTNDSFYYYLAQAVGSSQPKDTLTVIFESPNGKQLTIDCHANYKNLSAQLTTGTGSEDVDQFLHDQSVSQKDCLWSEPVMISAKSGSFDLSKEVSSLQILSDGKLVFKQNVSSSDSTITSNFMFIYLFTLISLLTRSFSPLN